MKKYFVTITTWISVPTMAAEITREVCEAFEHTVVTEDFVDTMIDMIKFCKAKWEKEYPRNRPFELYVNSEKNYIKMDRPTNSSGNYAFAIHLTEVKHEYSFKKGGEA